LHHVVGGLTTWWDVLPHLSVSNGRKLKTVGVLSVYTTAYLVDALPLSTTYMHCAW
jgi:hypothetical protein